MELMDPLTESLAKQSLVLELYPLLVYLGYTLSTQNFTAIKKQSVVINIYIGLCAIMAVFIWFNYQNPILNPNVYNQYSSKKSL